jgi:hypothetical protein
MTRRRPGELMKLGAARTLGDLSALVLSNGALDLRQQLAIWVFRWRVFEENDVTAESL